jgi:chromosome segregation ATPase
MWPKSRPPLLESPTSSRRQARQVTGSSAPTDLDSDEGLSPRSRAARRTEWAADTAKGTLAGQLFEAVKELDGFSELNQAVAELQREKEAHRLEAAEHRVAIAQLQAELAAEREAHAESRNTFAEDLQSEKGAHEVSKRGHEQTMSNLAQTRAEAKAAEEAALLKRRAMESDMESAREKLKLAKSEFEKVQLEMETAAAKALKLERALAAAQEETKAAREETKEAKRETAEERHHKEVAEATCKRQKRDMDDMKASLEAALEKQKRDMNDMKSSLESALESAVVQGEKKLSTALDQARKITEERDEKSQLAQNYRGEKVKVEESLAEVQERASQKMKELQGLVVEARQQLEDGKRREGKLGDRIASLEADLQKAQRLASKYQADGVSASDLLEALEARFNAETKRLQAAIDDEQRAAKSAAAKAASSAASAQQSFDREITELQERLKEKNALLKQQESQLTALSGDISKTRSRLDESNREHELTAAELKQQAALTAAELKKKHELTAAELKQQAADLERRLAAMTALRDTAEQKLQDEKHRQTYFDQEIAALKELLKEAEAETEEKDIECRRAVKEVSETRALLERTEAGLKQLREQSENSRTQMRAQVRDHSSELDNMKELSEQEKDELQKQMQATANELLQLNEKYRESKFGKQQVEEQLAEAVYELQRANEDLKDKRAELVEVSQDLDTKKDVLATTSENLEVTTRAFNKLKKEKSLVEEVKNQAVARVAELELDVETREKRAEFAEAEMERLQEDLVASLQANRVYSKRQEELGQEVVVKRMETQEANVQLDEAVGIVSKLHERLKEEREQANALLSEHEKLKLLQDRTRKEMEKAFNDVEKLEGMNEVTMQRYEGAILDHEKTQAQLAASRLEVVQAKKVLRLAQGEFDQLRDQRNSAEDKYIALKEAGEAHMREIVGAGEVMLSRYENGDFLSEADKCARQVQMALQEANAIAENRSKMSEDFPQQRLFYAQQIKAKHMKAIESRHTPLHAPLAVTYPAPATQTFVPVRNVPVWP